MTELPPYHRLPPGQLHHITLQQDDQPHRGPHLSPMEAVAWMAGEPHYGYPKCVPKRIAHFIIMWMTYLSNAEAHRFIGPVLPELTAKSLPDAEDRIALMPANWLVNTATPAWLNAAGLKDEALKLQSLSPPTTALRQQSNLGPQANRALYDATKAAWQRIQHVDCTPPGQTPPSLTAAESGTMAAASTSSHPSIAAMSLVCSHAALAAAQQGADIQKVRTKLQHSAAKLLRNMVITAKQVPKD